MRHLSCHIQKLKHLHNVAFGGTSQSLKDPSRYLFNLTHALSFPSTCPCTQRCISASLSPILNSTPQASRSSPPAHSIIRLKDGIILPVGFELDG